MHSSPRSRVIGSVLLVPALVSCSAGNVIQDAGADGAFDAHNLDATHDGAPPDSTCATIQGHAGVVRRPLDVIAVVDSTGSFDQPRNAIASNLAPSLIDVLASDGIDYRVIVVGGMITAPPPTTPQRYFFVSRGVGSRDLLGALPGHLSAALPYLRPDALKAVIDFSDATDNIGTRSEFYTGMMAADLVAAFGDASMPRYYVHAVTGVANNTPSSMPWAPTDPVVTTTCTGFTTTTAVELQQLSMETGGYRIPLCNFAEYGSFFDAVARQAISMVQVPCEFDQPTTTDGRMPDISYAVMTVRASDGTTHDYRPVASMASCGDGFYLVPGDAGASSGHVVLCPNTCNTVHADPGAMVSFAFECPPG